MVSLAFKNDDQNTNKYLVLISTSL